MMLEELEQIAEKNRAEAAAFGQHLRVCVASSCHSSGSSHVLERLKAEVKERGLETSAP